MKSLPRLFFCLIFLGCSPVFAQDLIYPVPQTIRGLVQEAERLRKEQRGESSENLSENSLAEAVKMGAQLRSRWPKEPEIDRQQIEAQGIRTLSGKYLTLFTDLEPMPAVDELPQVFDLAVVEYGRYFHLDPENYESWKITGCLIKDRTKFQQAGLMQGAPSFQHGYSRGYRLWLNDQPSDYYRRHLLIHEGVHAFMNFVFGTGGPPWYMESMAEYLGTHQWSDGKLVLGVMPRSAEDVPMWGRIKIIRDAVAANERKSPDAIFRFGPTVYDQPTGYAWSWGIGYFLDNHPRYQERFRAVVPYLTFPDFTDRLYRSLENDWTFLNNEWVDFTAQLTFGYRLDRTVIDFTPGKPLEGKAVMVSVDAARGWQNSGIALQKGRKYDVMAKGRVQLAKTPKIWWSEPDGVTVRYHQGMPLGLLIGAVVPDEPMSSPDATPPGIVFQTPFKIGSRTEISPETDGTLYLRINDSPAELDDNAGTLNVMVISGSTD